MGTRTDYAIQKTLDHVYLNQAIPNVGDAAGLPGSAIAGNWYMALFKNGIEVNYGGYARQALSRLNGLVRNANVITTVGQVNFPKSDGTGSQSANQIALLDFAGNVWHLQDRPEIPTSINVQPIIEAGAFTITGS